MTEGEAAAAATNGQTKDGEGDSQPQEMGAKIVRQIEYYFGDYNLPRDKFLQQEIKNDDGWVTLDTMTKFKRLASISSDKAVIADALRKASSSFMEMRHFFDKEAKKQGFKGSVLVVFVDQDKAQAFLELPEVKYNGIQLLRKWHKDYVEEKRKEIEERKAKKEAKRKKDEDGSHENDEETEDEPPKGTFLHFSGVAEGSEVTREDLKEALGEAQEQCAWVDYSKGMTQGYLRFKEPESNKTIMEKLDGKLKVKDMEVTLHLVEGEEEAEQLSKMKAARSRARANSSGGRKRRGGRGGGPSFKRKRT